MQIGRWSSYEELEETLTLDELYALYNEATAREIRQAKAFVRAFGADVDIDYGPDTQPTRASEDDGKALTDLFGRVSEKLGREIEIENGDSPSISGKIGYNKIN